MELYQATANTDRNVTGMVKTLNGNVEKLLEHLISKSDPKHIPVSVFCVLVGFILIFNFALVFGLSATERLGEKFGKAIGAREGVQQEK